jgi:hypothetical protein
LVVEGVPVSPRQFGSKEIKKEEEKRRRGRVGAEGVCVCVWEMAADAAALQAGNAPIPQTVDELYVAVSQSLNADPNGALSLNALSSHPGAWTFAIAACRDAAARGREQGDDSGLLAAARQFCLGILVDAVRHRWLLVLEERGEQEFVVFARDALLECGQVCLFFSPFFPFFFGPLSCFFKLMCGH